jgi:CDP-diglyceride synthetase
MDATAAMPSSKAAKVWKRTWVGGSIAGGFALVLWAASALDSALPLLAATVVLLALCIFEVQRMGTLAGRRLAWSLAPGVLVVASSIYVAIWEVPSSHEELTARALCFTWLAVSVPAALVAITVGFAFARSQSLVVRIAVVLAIVALVVPWPEESPRPDVGAGLQALPATMQFYGALVLLLFVALRVFVIGAVHRREALATLVLGVVLVVSIPGLTIAWMAFDHLGLVALIVMAKIGDTAAYYAGSAFGRHHPFKSISPGKTVEGCAASLVATALAGVAAVELGWLPSAPYGWLGGLLGGASVNLAAQASDLLESWLKRRAGVKDSGTWFGPSGGMLDLVDSFFLAAPVALIAWPLVFHFPPVWPES